MIGNVELNILIGIYCAEYMQNKSGDEKETVTDDGANKPQITLADLAFIYLSETGDDE